MFLKYAPAQTFAFYEKGFFDVFRYHLRSNVKLDTWNVTVLLPESRFFCFLQNFISALKIELKASCNEGNAKLPLVKQSLNSAN